MTTLKEVEKIIERQLKKNEKDLSYAVIEPLAEEWPFSSNGVYLFCGKMGSGKSYTIMKHILMTERLFDSPYYDTIIFSSTSGTLDKTVSAMKSDISTPIRFVKDTDLLSFLENHIVQKMLYYSLVQFIKSSGEEIDEIMKSILEKHKFYRIKDRKRVYDWHRIGQYASKVMSESGFNRYPSYSLLIMDDFAGHPLLAKVDSPLSKMLTKTRHYHITAILAIQTWRFIHFNFKRLCTDIVIWKGYCELDFKNMIKQTPNDQNWETLWNRYTNLPSKHSNMTLHITNSTVQFNE